MIDCPWCKFNPACKHAPDCELKTLPYEKDEILMQIKYEVRAVDMLKRKLVRTIDEGAIRMIFDKMFGIKVMSERLVADFGMTMEQIKEFAPSRKLTLIESARLAMVLKSGGD